MRVLLVSHDGYRAGATIFLLNMLRWFTRNTGLQCSVLMRQPGEMQAAFEELAPTSVWQAEAPEPASLLAKLSGRRPSQTRRTLQAVLDEDSIDLVYLNTLTLGDMLQGVDLGGRPVISHVHELGMTLRTYGRGAEAQQCQASDALVAVSHAVARHLVTALGCPPAKVHTIHGFVPLPGVASAGRQALHQELLAPLGVPANAWVIGLCGYADMRKGVDLLVPLARLVPERIGGRPVHFIWVGKIELEYSLAMAQHDGQCADVGDRVHFPGPTARPQDWMSCFDVHALLAREDPFPLVVMEAAAQGVPTLCFDGAGGAPEFVRDDAGASVPYLDLPAFAAALARLLGDARALAAHGACARARVHAEHGPDVVLPRIHHLMDSVWRNVAAARRAV